MKRRKVIGGEKCKTIVGHTDINEYRVAELLIDGITNLGCE